MSALLPLILPLLLIAAISVASLFLLRAWNNRTTSVQAAYNVGQHEARREMQLNILRAFTVIVVGVILLAIFFTTRLFQPEVIIAPTLVPTAAATVTATAPPPQTATTAPVIVNPATPATEATPTATPSETAVPTTATPASTETAAPQTATVSSGVGVWLRAEPSTEGEQIEWLLQGTELTLLEGTSQGESFRWQLVQAPSGASGWVADEFITLSSP